MWAHQLVPEHTRDSSDHLHHCHTNARSVEIIISFCSRRMVSGSTIARNACLPRPRAAQLWRIDSLATRATLQVQCAACGSCRPAATDKLCFQLAEPTIRLTQTATATSSVQALADSRMGSSRRRPFCKQRHQPRLLQQFPVMAARMNSCRAKSAAQLMSWRVHRCAGALLAALAGGGSGRRRAPSALSHSCLARLQRILLLHMVQHLRQHRAPAARLASQHVACCRCCCRACGAGG